MLKYMNVGFERVPVKIPTIPPSNFSKKLRRNNARLLKLLYELKSRKQ